MSKIFGSQFYVSNIQEPKNNRVRPSVARGITLLDKYVPGWREKIDLLPKCQAGVGLTVWANHLASHPFTIRFVDETEGPSSPKLRAFLHYELLGPDRIHCYETSYGFFYTREQAEIVKNSLELAASVEKLAHRTKATT